MQVSALRSGSSGNAFLVRAGRACILIDAGLPLRTLRQEMARRGVYWLDAVFLTHEHSDHISGVGAISRGFKAPVLANEVTLSSLPVGCYEREVLHTGSELRIGSLTVRSFPVPHDSAQAVGYWLDDGDHRVCLATDLGCVPDHLLEYMQAADLAVLESNYDPASLAAGPYPVFLKIRIASTNGHLSNLQAGEAIVRAASDGLQEVWLAHLSAENNSPWLARDTVAAYLQQAGLEELDLRVALRDRPSLEWPGPQLYRQGTLLP